MTSENAAPGLTAEEFRSLMREKLPFAALLGVEIIEMAAGRAALALPFRREFLRPGGSIGGPVLMGLADVATYAAVLTVYGRVELAVTSSLSVNFLRKPAPAALRAEARLLKLGRRLAVAEVALRSAGIEAMVAHAVVTYAIPTASDR